MIKFFFFLIVNLYINLIFSQIGLRIAYLKPDFSKVENKIIADKKIKVFADGFSAGIDFSHRINGKGIVLLPYVEYSYFVTVAEGKKYFLYGLSFGIPVKIYPFNIKGDCGCPDFSMRNKFFEKNFFLVFNNRVNYNNKKVVFEKRVSDDYFNFLLGLGLGITIPFENDIKVEPYVIYNRGFYDRWDSDLLLLGESDITNNYGMAEFGLRIEYIFK